MFWIMANRCSASYKNNNNYSRKKTLHFEFYKDAQSLHAFWKQYVAFCCGSHQSHAKDAGSSGAAMWYGMNRATGGV